MNASERVKTQIDWGFFVVIFLGTVGFARLLPGDYMGRPHMMASLAILLVMTFRDLNQSFRAMLSSPLLAFTTGWAIVASLAAARPADTIASAAVFILIVTYAFARQATTETTLQTFALATSVALVPSIVGLVMPIAGIPVLEHAGSSGGYAGYFPWNSTSGACASAVLISIAVLVLTAGFVWWYVPATAAALLMLVLANSATSYMCLLGTAGALTANAFLGRLRPETRPLLLGVLSIAAAFAALNISRHADSMVSTLSDSMGRPEGFSGRTDIWVYVLSAISESPWVGYGSGFWATEPYAFGQTNGQSGFLDIGLKWGVPALIAVFAMVVLAGFRLASTTSPLLAFWALGVIPNLSNSHMAGLGLPSLALWTAVGAAAAKTRTRSENQRAAGDQPAKTKSGEYRRRSLDRAPAHSAELLTGRP